MMSRTYEQLIPRRLRDPFEKALAMDTGYVLGFSDRTFADFFFEELNIDTSVSSLFDGRGTSKAKRLRSFIENAPASVVAKALRKLWEYRESMSWPSVGIRDNYFAVVAIFEGASDHIDSSAFEAFEPSQTLDELIAAIRRDLNAKKPEAGLDRLHTYCMKRFASLVRKHEGGECGENDALHARVGRYAKLLTAQRNLTEMSERIIKSSISVFESFNSIRNSKSLAHDNPHLIQPDEARFIFDSVAALLRYIKAVDGQSFED